MCSPNTNPDTDADLLALREWQLACGDRLRTLAFAGGRFLVRFLLGLLRVLRFLLGMAGTFMDGLENGLTRICKCLDKYQKSFVFFGGLLVVVILSLTLPWVEQGAKGPQWIPWVGQGQNEPQWTPWGKVVSSIVTPLVAFVITLMGLRRVFRQFNIQVEQVKDQAKKASMEMAAEQFKNAVDHLGNDKQAVVLGGVHALHNLAMTFPNEYSKQVFEVLCSFIREETRKEEYKTKVLAEIESSDKTQKASSDTLGLDTSYIRIDTTQITLSKQVTSLIVIQTIVDKLFREIVELDETDKKTVQKRILYRNHRANLSGAFLRGISLYNANLLGAWLRNVNLQGADLRKANLRGIGLYRVNLRDARLWEANLQGARLYDADLQGANLNGADFRGVQGQSFWVDYRKAIIEAVRTGFDLKTDLSGVRLYDDDENELTTEDAKKEWFIKHSIRDDVVNDLPTKEVLKLFKVFKDWYL